MASHEFGIMEENPKPGKRYDEYEPQKYSAISVSDKMIEIFAKETEGLNFFWHTLSVSGNCLAYCGITLIAPETSKKIVEIIKDKKDFSNLESLFLKAIEKNKFVIHFGL